MTILNNILLLIICSCLSITQASSSFKSLDMPTPTHTTPIFITEAFRLVTYVQPFKKNGKVKVTAYIAIAY